MTPPTHCECCGKKFTKRNIAIRDISTKTKQQRGWLCRICRLTIYKHGDDIAGLRTRIAELEAGKSAV